MRGVLRGFDGIALRAKHTAALHIASLLSPCMVGVNAAFVACVVGNNRSVANALQRCVQVRACFNNARSCALSHTRAPNAMFGTK